MKKTVHIAFLIVFTLLSYCYALAGTPKLYAVVIGISDYKDEAIPNLKYAEKDAKAFYDFLRSPFSGAIPEENIAFLTGPNATRSNILKYAVDIFRRSTKDDMVIFYFSGHGKGDPSDNSGYLLGYDSENENEAATALSMDELKSKIDRCQAKLKVSYVDACHAGLFKSYNTKGTLEENNEIIATTYQQSVQNAGDGNVAFLASSARQQSLEDDKLGNGVFTYFLLKGLKGEADKEQKDAHGYNDGLVTVGEMATYLGNKIPAATKYKQKPTVDGTYDEDFPLSILKSNVVIASEIAKRPVTQKKALSSLKTSTTVTDYPTTDMKQGQCINSNISPTHYYGELNIVNNYNEDVVVYYHEHIWTLVKSNFLLAKGEKTPLGRIDLWGMSTSLDIKFYIKTVDESKPIKYGVLTYNVEACKNKTLVITDKNLYLSVNGEKR